MNYKDLILNINTLKSIALFGDDINRSKASRLVKYGFGENTVGFAEEENVDKWENCVEKLMLPYEINKTITENKFRNKLSEFLLLLNKNNTKCDRSLIDEFYTEFKDLSILEYELFVPIYGIKIEGDKYTLSDFTIYNFAYLKEYLKATHTVIKEIEELHFEDFDSEYAVGIKVKARDQAKAIEIANNYIERFENVLNFVVADKLKGPGIFNFKGAIRVRHITASEHGIGSSNQNKGMFIITDINDQLCLGKGKDQLWILITKNNKSQLEERILNAVEWVGKAIYETDQAKAIVQYVFALEGLLQLNEKDFITSSIASQISEWLAFIVTDELKSRLRVVKYFKRIYGKRSGVVHGGNSNITDYDISIASQLCRMVIFTLLNEDEYKNIKTISQLREIIDNKKFRGKYWALFFSFLD